MPQVVLIGDVAGRQQPILSVQVDHRLRRGEHGVHHTQVLVHLRAVRPVLLLRLPHRLRVERHLVVRHDVRELQQLLPCDHLVPTPPLHHSHRCGDVVTAHAPVDHLPEGQPAAVAQLDHLVAHVERGRLQPHKRRGVVLQPALAAALRLGHRVAQLAAQSFALLLAQLTQRPADQSAAKADVFGEVRRDVGGSAAARPRRADEGLRRAGHVPE
mmetsp:Transcript_338/g.945  ORF Transcript_338/g.945 Transcript_338/m.945 type:complete len:214 (+) Transcript_338:1628-2269(+)